MESIRSRQNPKIRLVRALQRRKTRDKEGLLLVEGSLHIGEAVAAGAALEFMLAAPEALSGEFAAGLPAELEARGTAVYEVSAELLDSLSGREESKGLLAVARQQWSRLEDLHAENFGRGVAVVAPQDPGNLGSLLRSIDAAGADGLIVLDGGVDAYHPSAVRAGMGAHFWKVLTRASFAEFAEWASEQGFRIYGSSARGGKDFHKVSFMEPFILLLGSEREGLNEAQQALCDEMLSIPMRGRASSLNLAVAAGILLYGGMQARDKD